MTYSTSNTYQMKRKILTFSSKISKQLSKPERKFTADITYGMLAARSCLLTDVADRLHEDSKKINIVDRLSKHLEKGTPAQAAASYLQTVKKWVPASPVIYIDDSDVVKPDGYKFEALGIVRMVLKAPPQKMSIKKDIMLQKPVSLPAAAIRSAYFPEYIPLLKRIINQPIPLPLMPWNRVRHFLAGQPLPWTVVMTITRCS